MLWEFTDLHLILFKECNLETDELQTTHFNVSSLRQV